MVNYHIFANKIMKESIVGIFLSIILATGTFSFSSPIVDIVRVEASSNTTSSESQVRSDESEAQPQQQEEQQKQQAATPNHRPSADAGPDKKVNEGVIVTLDASRSLDSDKDKLTYQWRQISGPRITLENSENSIATFAALEVNRDATLTFAVTVSDDRGGQDRDTVRLSVNNLDTGTGTGGTINSNNNNNALTNTSANALTNLQRNNGNNIRNVNNASQLQSDAMVQEMARTSAITVQATLSPLQAFPTNSLVNNRAFYDISFQTGSSGTIRQVLLTFPAGTVVGQSAVVEVSGIGLGTFSNSGQTVTYTVTSPTTIAAGVTIRLQVDYIFNPPAPSPAGGYKIQVTTKDPGGATIDSGMTSGYQIKQIQSVDIANNAITSAKIQDGQVGSSDLAPGATVPQVIQRVSPSVTMGPNEGREALINCNPGEVATGGGFFLGTLANPERTSSKVFFLRSVANTPFEGNQQGWIVWGFNTDTVSHAFTTVVGCLKLTP
jgi:PKD domain